MHRCYSDILELTEKKPVWFDEQAVPRFCEFSPAEVDVYAHECALVEIACQGCDHRFKVAIVADTHDGDPSIANAIRANEVHYGDPPNIQCCAAGPTMSSMSVRVIEYWTRQGPGGVSLDVWVRDRTLEIELPDEFG